MKLKIKLINYIIKLQVKEALQRKDVLILNLQKKKALEYNSNIREAAVTKTVGIKEIIKEAKVKAEDHNKKRQALNKRERSYERQI